MSPPGSVTHWIEQLKAGDRPAAQKLWESYFRRMVGLARQKLRDTPRRVADEEDVALSAFDSFCRGAEAGRFPQLFDRDDLWQILVLITARKAYDLARHERSQRQGRGRVQNVSALAAGDSAGPSSLPEILSQEPDPQFAAQIAEQCERLLDMLGDDQLRSVAVWKMEGYTNEEIAAKLSCAVVTVERRLRLIRRIWQHESTRSRRFEKRFSKKM